MKYPIEPIRWYSGKTAYWRRPTCFPPGFEYLCRMRPEVDIGTVVDATNGTAAVKWHSDGAVTYVPTWLLRDPHEELATSAVEGAQYGVMP
jgi:hypothetical protein